MAVIDILSTSFLISLGITLLLVGLLGMYFSQKIMDQDHKLSSMAGVVTSMADELQFLRSMIQQDIPPTLVKANHPNALSSDIKLIPVSDDEDESDDDSEDDEESDSDDEDSDNDRESLEIMSELINISEVPSIKVINMTESTFYNESIENEVEELAVDEDEDNDNISESEEDEGEDENNNEVEIEVDESTMDIMNSSMLKSINILSSEDDKVDYKKLSLAKLKDLVLEKGLTKDPSRMKKPELLKLLEQ